MKIGNAYVDNVAFGVAALIVSIVSAWFTYRTNRGMLDTTKGMAADNKRMADANEAMVAANQAMVTENRRMAQANEDMVELTRSMERSASESTRLAEQEAARLAQVREEANKARFQFEAGRRTGDSIQAYLENTGKHHADVSKADIYWDERKIGDGEPKRVKPDERLPIAFRFPPDMAAMPDDRFATIRLSYTDGNGSHDKEWTIRFFGGNRPLDWQIEVMAEPEF